MAGSHPIVDRILAILRQHGSGLYFGEAVSEAEHALQAALLAEQAGAPPSLQAAALLHDIGHLLHHWPEEIAAHGVDTHHEDLGAAFLASHFGPEVVEPVRLHVSAKRYLCAMESDYLAGLSPASIQSLTLQGGPFSEEEVRRFETSLHWRAALALRRWDDQAKVAGLPTPDLEHFRPILDRVVVSPR